MEKRVFRIKCYVNNEVEDTNLIKNIEKEEYKLEIGKKDANKNAFTCIKELEAKVITLLKQEYETDNIEVALY